MIKKFTVTLPSKDYLQAKVKYDKNLNDYLVTLPKESVFFASDLIKIAHQIGEVREQNYKYKR
jgi:hypothetical protein